MSLTPLPDVLLRPYIEEALREDLGRAGDITTDAILREDIESRATLNARQDGVIAGLDLARLAFTCFGPEIVFTPFKKDGDLIKAGDCLAQVEGSARALLSAERTAVNYLSHLSGIASETRKLVDAARPHKAKICCTRKTTPGLRVLEKYAVRAGGGCNHRFGLDDAILIKDNHIAIAGGIRTALERAYKNAGHLVKIEIEVDTLTQLDDVIAQAAETPISAVLLDNMAPGTLKQAVDKVAGRFLTEASGGVTLQSVAAIAATGVDIISAGWITHSAPALDIGLDV